MTIIESGVITETGENYIDINTDSYSVIENIEQSLEKKFDILVSTCIDSLDKYSLSLEISDNNKFDCIESYIREVFKNE